MRDSPAIKIPTKIIGPINISGLPNANESSDVWVPLSSFETPIWHSVQRGANISRLANHNIKTFLIDDSMSRSIILQSSTAKNLINVKLEIENDLEYFNNLIANHSKHTKLISWHIEIVGNLIYVRFKFHTKEASGHNMSTYASQIILDDLLKRYSFLEYVSISGNICTDKKNSSINGIIGRGKYVIAEMILSNAICQKYLRSDIRKLSDLNVKKNLLGSILSGGVRTANAHFANMLLALYLATGQDSANIIEGSQGFVYTEVKGEDLYFSVTLPNIIVGTVGSGKNHELVKKNLKILDIAEDNMEKSSIRLAMIAAAVVLCGEVSLLAAQANKGELIKTHIVLERNQRSK